MSGEKFRHSMPSKRVKTTGKYFAVSVENFSVAPSVTCRFTLLFRWMAPVRNTPGGTTTRPPPAAWQASIALLMASVQSVAVLAAAPYLVIKKSRAGKAGALIRARIFGTSSQGSSVSSELLEDETGILFPAPAIPGEATSDCGNSKAPAPVVMNVFTKSRRLVISFSCARSSLRASTWKIKAISQHILSLQGDCYHVPWSNL